MAPAFCGKIDNQLYLCRESERNYGLFRTVRNRFVSAATVGTEQEICQLVEISSAVPCAPAVGYGFVVDLIDKISTWSRLTLNDPPSDDPTVSLHQGTFYHGKSPSNPQVLTHSLIAQHNTAVSS